VTGRRERRCKQLLDDLKEKTGYWKLKEEALNRTALRTHFGRGYGRVVRQTTKLLKSLRPLCDCSQQFNYRAIIVYKTLLKYLSTPPNLSSSYRSSVTEDTRNNRPRVVVLADNKSTTELKYEIRRSVNFVLQCSQKMLVQSCNCHLFPPLFKNLRQLV